MTNTKQVVAIGDLATLHKHIDELPLMTDGEAILDLLDALA